MSAEENWMPTDLRRAWHRTYMRGLAELDTEPRVRWWWSSARKHKVKMQALDDAMSSALTTLTALLKEWTP